MEFVEAPLKVLQTLEIITRTDFVFFQVITHWLGNSELGGSKLLNSFNSVLKCFLHIPD